MTPPPSLSPTKGQLKRFDFIHNEQRLHQSIDDSAVPFILEMRDQKRKLKQQRLEYEQKLLHQRTGHKRNVAVPLTKHNYRSPQRFNSKIQKMCKQKLMPTLREKSNLKLKPTTKSPCIPLLPLRQLDRDRDRSRSHRVRGSNIGTDADASSLHPADNRFAIGWNFLNKITKETLLSDDDDCDSERGRQSHTDRLKSFMSYTSMCLAFNHYTQRWQTAEDIRSLGAMTTSRYRKEAVAMAADLVDRKQINMNRFEHQFPNIPHKRFKKSLKTCYEILEAKPDGFAATTAAHQTIPIFLPSLNIVFDPSLNQQLQKRNQTERIKKTRRYKYIARQKEKQFKAVERKLDRLKVYRKELKAWRKTQTHNQTPFIAMMSFDQHDGTYKKYKNVIKQSVVRGKAEKRKAVVSSSVRVPKL